MSRGRGLTRTAFEINDCNHLQFLISLPVRNAIKKLAKFVHLICGVVASAGRGGAWFDTLSLEVQFLEIALRDADKVRDFR